MNYFISFVLCLVLWTFPTMLHAVDSNTVSSSVTGTTTVVELDTFRSEDDTNLYNEGWNPYE